MQTSFDSATVVWDGKLVTPKPVLVKRTGKTGEENMKKGSKSVSVVITTLIAATIVIIVGCGKMNPLHSSDDNWKSVAQLWSDVPKMDGLNQSKLEPPFFIKLVVRTALDQVLGRGG